MTTINLKKSLNQVIRESGFTVSGPFFPPTVITVRGSSKEDVAKEFVDLLREGLSRATNGSQFYWIEAPYFSPPTDVDAYWYVTAQFYIDK